MLEKIITPTSASHKIASSFAFFSKPFLRFENVTCLLVELSILLITILPLPIPNPNNQILPNHKILLQNRSRNDLTKLQFDEEKEKRKRNQKKWLLQKRSRRRVDPHAVVNKEEEEQIDFPRNTERILKRKRKRKLRREKNGKRKSDY